MSTNGEPHESPKPDSPHVPVWMPSQFKPSKVTPFRSHELESYSLGETIANSISNGVGATLALAGLVIVIVVAALHGGGVRVLTALAFAIPMLLAFLMSTLYHALPQESAKQVFKVLGHDFVFLYIAGAFTPYCVLLLGNASGYGLCGVEWTLAVIGVLIESIWRSRPKWVPLVLCLVMCFAALPLAPAFAAVLEPAGWWLLVAATVCFMLGLVFYLLRKVPYMWFVSHVVVLAGSICLFLSVVLFVV